MVPQKGRATGDTGGEKRTTVVHVSTREASLKRRLRRHLKSLGFQKTEQGELAPPGTDKDAIRSVHSIQREGRLAANKQFLTAQAANLAGYFASGEDIDPGKIRPVLQRIETESWEGDLFRLASLTWSVPVSSGFGRRLRYLVWDDCNGKLIGIIAIGDPVFNLSVRDNLIDWMVEDHSKRLVNIMDAYVLGAVPPLQHASRRKALGLSPAHSRHLRRLHQSLRRHDGNHLETGKKSAPARDYDIVFDGALFGLQPAETRRRRIHDAHRLHGRLAQRAPF